MVNAPGAGLTTGVANPALGGLPSCRVELQLKPNTPEPADQGIQDYSVSNVGTEICRMVTF